jgi:hypothetical protein
LLEPSVMIIPESYNLKRLIARHRHSFWHAECLRALPSAPIYLLPDRSCFDAEEMEKFAAHICAMQPLALPHDAVLFEIHGEDQPRTAVAFAWTNGPDIDACLFALHGRSRQWSDVLCLARLYQNGDTEFEANHRLAGNREHAEECATALSAIVWRGLAILSHAGQVSEHQLSRVRRARFDRSGVTGWNYRVVAIDPIRIRATAVAKGGTHASPRWHIRRGHWRTLADGRRVLVRECEVGEVARGGVVKDYHVRMGEAA